jgi:Magnesium chelatase, subunit ChlI
MSLSWLWQQQGKRDEARELLARRLTTILPAMTLAEAIETTRIHRVAGLTGDRTALVTTRPCRAPHHTLSDAGLIGGGHMPMAGDVSLATMACSSWMHGPSAAVMASRSCANGRGGCHIPTISRVSYI